MNSAIEVARHFSSFHLSWCCYWIFFSRWNVSFYTVKGMGEFCRDELMTRLHRDSLSWKILLQFYGPWFSRKRFLFSEQLQSVWGFQWHCLRIRFSVAYFLKHLWNIHRAAILEEDILHCCYHRRVANSSAAVLKKQRRVEENFKCWGGQYGAQKTEVSKSPAIPDWTSKLCTPFTASGSCLPSWQIPPWPGSTRWGKTQAKMAETPYKKK